MSDLEIPDEQILGAANYLATRLDDGHEVEGETAASIGYLMITRLGEELDVVRLASALRLLGAGIAAQADNDPGSGARHIAMTFGCGQLASITGSLDHWSDALRWAEASTRVRHASQEDYDDAVLDLFDLHVEHLACRQAQAEEVATEGARVAAAIQPLIATVGDPRTRALLSLRHARILLGTTTVDLDDRVGLEGVMRDALALVPDDDPDLGHDLRVYADLCESLFEATGDLEMADRAIEAMTRALTASGEDNDHADDNVRLAHLLDARWQGEDQPASVRDRIIDCMDTAVTLDDDPDLLLWYGYRLWSRGTEIEDADDLRSAVRVLEGFASAKREPNDDLGFCRTMMAASHQTLLSLTGDPTHSDWAINCATEALGLPLVDEETRLRLHYIRLDGVFPFGERADLDAVLAARPVTAWLAQGRLLAETSDQRDSPYLARLALWVLRGEMALHFKDPVRMVDGLAHESTLFDGADSLLAVARSVPDLSSGDTDAIVMLTELFTNLRRTLHGDGKVDSSTTRTILAAEPDHDLRAGFENVQTSLALMVGVRTGSIAEIDRAVSHLTSTGGSKGIAAMLTFVRNLYTNASTEDLYRSVREARDSLAEVEHEAEHAVILDLMDSVTRILGPVIDGETVPERIENPYATSLAAPFRVVENVGRMLIAKDVDGLRSLCQELDELVRTGEPVLQDRYNAAARTRGMVYAALSHWNPTTARRCGRRSRARRRVGRRA